MGWLRERLSVPPESTNIERGLSMLHLHLRLLAKDRAELIEGLRMVIREIETARDLNTYVMGSSGADPTFLLEVEATAETDVQKLADQAIEKDIAEEREACAKLIDKQAQGVHVLIDHAPTEIRREDMKRLKHSLNVAAACVRTRE